MTLLNKNFFLTENFQGGHRGLRGGVEKNLRGVNKKFSTGGTPPMPTYGQNWFLETFCHDFAIYVRFLKHILL